MLFARRIRRGRVSCASIILSARRPRQTIALRARMQGIAKAWRQLDGSTKTGSGSIMDQKERDQMNKRIKTKKQAEEMRRLQMELGFETERLCAQAQKAVLDLRCTDGLIKDIENAKRYWISSMAAASDEVLAIKRKAEREYKAAANDRQRIGKLYNMAVRMFFVAGASAVTFAALILMSIAR